MYHIYETPGLILRSQPHGEANRIYTILTKDFGMIRATAQGVRLAHGKLKASLQTFNHSLISTVRGKEYWRITSAVADERFLNSESALAQKQVLIRLTRILLRLLPEAEPNPILFSSVLAVFEVLHDPNNKALHREIECLAVARFLSLLGYMTDTLTECTPDSLLEAVKNMNPEARRTLVTHINSVLTETQL